MGRKARKYFRKHIPGKAIRKANRRRPASSLEKRVQEWLREDGIFFKSEFPLGHCHVDLFLPPNTLVELNGCYYHACLGCYPKESRRSSHIREKDRKRHAFLRSQGFALEVIWECEVARHPRKTRRLLNRLAKSPPEKEA